MKIAGDITVDDYLRAVRAYQSLAPPWYALIRPLHYAAVLAIAIFCGTTLKGEQGAYICVFCTLLPIISSWCLNGLSRQPALNYYRRHAQIHNLGHAEYELEEGEIHFSGSTFDSVIPIASILKVASSGGTTLLVFGNQSCFVIPRAITAGELEPFVAEIRRRVAERPGFEQAARDPPQPR